MPKSFSTAFNIDSDTLDKLDCFDSILDSDSLFFINFLKVRDTQNPFLKDSYQKILEVFRKIILLLEHSKKSNDPFFKSAYSLLNMSEFEEICLGYSMKSTSGSGSGNELKNKLFNTAKSIIEVGIKEPEIFELVGLFEEGIGPDRLSDFIGHTIEDDLRKFTKHILKTLNLPEKLINPYNKKELILLPKEILHELPIAKDWSDLEDVCFRINSIRNEINSAIGSEWSKYSKSDKKKELKKILFKNKELLLEVIKEYRNYSLENYDFINDPMGEIHWYRKSKEYSANYPLLLNILKIEKSKDLLDLVTQICEKFKQLIEFNGLWEVLYDNNLKPRKERIAQKVFLGISESYCEANNIDISPEVNSGRGAIDFKFSKGYSIKVIVEIKLTTNTQLDHGYTVQIEEYQKSEKHSESIYLVLDNGGNKNRLSDLIDLHKSNKSNSIKSPELIVVDANPKKTASKKQTE